MIEPDSDHDRQSAVTRRQLLVGGAVAGGGAVIAAAGSLVVAHAPRRQATAAAPSERAAVAPVVAFHGRHQAGVDTPAQQHATFVALDLVPSADRAALGRMMRLLTADARALTSGRGPLADAEPELAADPARLTVTFGFGPGLVRAAGGDAPAWLAPLPAFSIDRLDAALSGGDLLLQICGDNALAVAHARRMLLADTHGFAALRWSQSGFRSRDAAAASGAGRNLMGQVDGTVNPLAGTADFDRVVWARTGWLAGGTGMVIRRIRMNLDTWAELDRPGREQVIGRTLANGAPLTGHAEGDDPDFEATDAAGFPVIAEFSHLRRARGHPGGVAAEQRIYRRPYNYESVAPDPRTGGDAGLIFVSYQADVARQFVPMQQRLAELDLLNMWTTPVGSAVFAVPPGCSADGFVGETLLG